jgi:threonine dehydrogenase-like Zn-dependent dehydrogenase
MARPAAASALWYEAAGVAAIREETLPPPGPDEVLIETSFSGISRGTESLVFHGRVPPSEHERMRGPGMAGSFAFPVKYGYAAVGRAEGRTVFALHPHQTAFLAKREALAAVPDDVPARRAVLAANMETALNAVWDAGIGPLDRVAVVGAGVVGALTAHLASRIAGADVVLIDVDPAKAALAAALGVGFAAPGAAEGERDVVVHASSSAAGLATALSLAGFEATVLELSWYGAARIEVGLGDAFHAKRIRLVSSQVGHVAPSRRPRWSHAARLAGALRLLADERLDALLAPDIPFASLPERLGGLLAPGGSGLCQVVAYPAACP